MKFLPILQPLKKLENKKPKTKGKKNLACKPFETGRLLGVLTKKKKKSLLET